MVLSLPLQLESVESVSFEGSRDEEGRDFVAVRVGIRIPVQALREALSELQHRLGDAEARSNHGKTTGEGLNPSIAIKNTFVDLDESHRSPSVQLARTTTAPATCRGGVHTETILEEEECDDADLDLPDSSVDGVGLAAPVPLAHTVTHDPYSYEMGDATTWLPPQAQDAHHMQLPPPLPLPVPPYFMPGMPLVPPWGWCDPNFDPNLTPGLAFPQTLPAEPAPLSTASFSSMPPVIERPAARPQALRRTYSVGSGRMRVHWTVPSETLESTEAGHVESPDFDLALGDDYPRVPFRLRIWPDDSVGASFQDSDGKGSVELVCSQQLTDMVPDVKFCISVGSGALRQPSRGPVTHNFEDVCACGLPKENAIWDFRAAVDSSASSGSVFTVCLEVLPGSAAVGQPAAHAPEERVLVDGDGASETTKGAASEIPQVIVKNTFVDVADSNKPASMLRTTTAPAQYVDSALFADASDKELAPRIHLQPRVVEEEEPTGAEDEDQEEEEAPAPLPSDTLDRPPRSVGFDRTATLDPYTYERSNPQTWLGEEAGAPLEASASTPELPPLRPQVVHRTFNVETGSMRLEWVVSSRKLSSADTHAAVSPAFDLSFGESHPSVRFKMLIHPKVVDERKGGGSFKTAGGRGYVELACEEMLPSEAPQVIFKIAIGTGVHRSPFRGPVVHDFSQKKVCGLPKEQALWNFNSAVDKESKTFVVCLEILPKVSGDIVTTPAPKPVGTKKW